MEQEVRQFLAIIVRSMSMVLLWMMVQTLFGIKMGYLFLDEQITVWHGVYYLFLAGSFVWVFRYVRRQVMQMPRFDHNNL
jgi:Ca2+/Na+ antiporter